MRRQTRGARGLIVIGLLALAGIAGFLAAGGAASGATRSSGTVSLRTTKLGRVLVNSHGRTLYLFMKDKSAHSTCSGQCAKFWPPLIVKTKPTAGSGVKASLLGWTKRSDGTMQVTYNKHPLYLFVKDKAAGQVNGENIDAFGAEWYAVNAKGVKVEPGEHTGTGTTPGTTTTTPGYTNTSTIPGY
jgi:predicted lipoprotein with Yx(FWY)xxD motif